MTPARWTALLSAVSAAVAAALAVEGTELPPWLLAALQAALVALTPSLASARTKGKHEAP